MMRDLAEYTPGFRAVMIETSCCPFAYMRRSHSARATIKKFVLSLLALQELKTWEVKRIISIAQKQYQNVEIEALPK